MDYCEAVALAKQGREEGYRFLYETTYKSKYYLALQYMKDEDAAQDVLQEAYMRAFSRLDMLEQPEAFSGWLGKIVGNTAKNMLQKKNPLLFSEMAEEEEDVPFLYEQEDESPEYQPELSYTRRETQELVHEMIDALSEEQRVCILMYEIEGISIREIAAALNCSENTVKSRLNYGRKNIKKRAEELQKKGYKLYGLAPLSSAYRCGVSGGRRNVGSGTGRVGDEAVFSAPESDFQGKFFYSKKSVSSYGGRKAYGDGRFPCSGMRRYLCGSISCISGEESSRTGGGADRKRGGRNACPFGNCSGEYAGNFRGGAS